MAPIKETTTFHPKRSKHMPTKVRHLTGDEDTWVERFVYDEKGRKRAFFQSVKTDECHWDEPPSGASNIVLANELDQFPSLKKYRSMPPST